MQVDPRKWTIGSFHGCTEIFFGKFDTCTIKCELSNENIFKAVTFSYMEVATNFIILNGIMYFLFNF